MRNLQECQAEVFRRSEQRMQARKRLRRRMQTTCLLLVLCLAACGACFLPIEETLPAAGKAEMQFFTENVLAYAGGGFSTDGEPAEYGSITVSAPGMIPVMYASAEKLRTIHEWIDAITSNPENPFIFTEGWGESDILAAGGPLYSIYPDNTADFESTNPPSYKIQISQADGTFTEYLLTKTALINQTTDEIFFITDGTYHAIMDALGLPSN